MFATFAGVKDETNPVADALASGDEEHQRTAAEIAASEPDHQTAKAMSITSVAVNLSAFVLENSDVPLAGRFPNEWPRSAASPMPFAASERRSIWFGRAIRRSRSRRSS